MKQRSRVLKRFFLWLLYGAILLSLLFFLRSRLSSPTPVGYIAARAEGSFSLPFDVIQYLLGLSSEEKGDLSKIDIHGLETRLLQCPAMDKAQVRKLFPDTLVIDYALRKPVFQLGGGQNLVLDEEGCVFRRAPYFPALQLPNLYFPHSDTPMGLIQTIVNNKELFLSCVSLCRSLKHLGFHVESIDAEEALAFGLFRREIRVKTLIGQRSLFLRLPVKNPTLLLKRLSLILQYFPEYSGIVDLRFPDVAYLE